MWLLAWSKAGLLIAIEMSPSLSATFDPPSAFIRADTGRLMNEKTDLPALDTCAAHGIVSAEHRMQTNMKDFLLKSGTKLQFFLHICKFFYNFARDFGGNTKNNLNTNQKSNNLYVVKGLFYRP
jgi:hypothetical protein